jgi:hypothetical protein
LSEPSRSPGARFGGTVRRRMIARFALFPFVCAVALGRALLSTPPAPPERASAAVKRKAFAEFRAHEREDRNKAAHDFPTDPWSQDDAFHAYESERARSFADKNHVTKTDIFDALDEGMRAARVRGDRSMIATVPPCHPRAIY